MIEKHSVPVEYFNLGLRISLSIDNFSLDQKFQSRCFHLGGHLCVEKRPDGKIQSTIGCSNFHPEPQKYFNPLAFWALMAVVVPFAG